MQSFILIFVVLVAAGARGDTVTLESGLAQLGSVSPTVQVADSRVEEAGHLVGEANSTWMPTITFRALQDVSDFGNRSYGVFLNQRIYDWRRGADISLANQAEQTARLNRAQVLRRTRIAFIQSYYDFLAAREQSAYIEGLYGRVSRATRRVEAAWRRRATSRKVYLSIRSSYQALSELRTTQLMTRDTAFDLLRQELKKPTLGQDAIQGNLGVEGLDIGDTDELVKRAVGNSPDLKLLESAEKENQYAWDQSMAEHFPSVALNASYQVDEGFNAIREATDGDNFVVFVRLEVPLFSGLSSLSTRRRYKERDKQIILQQEAARPTVVRTIRQMVARFRLLKAQLPALDERRKIAREFWRASDSQYRVRAITTEEWLTRLLDTQDVELLHASKRKEFLVLYHTIREMTSPLAIPGDGEDAGAVTPPEAGEEPEETSSEEGESASMDPGVYPAAPVVPTERNLTSQASRQPEE